ncbi:hypothetical protein SDC9_176555 [bioreactor metagenome]|uniref:Uncharacterized protein n=1 Tax=bioreactor metagenome TaxID=1076179 RepID=A0A645GYJ1_9ZZZZ
MIGVQHRLIELLPEFLGHWKADVLVLAVARFVAGHGDEQALGAVHHLHVPDGEAVVQVDGREGPDAALRPDGADFHVHLHRQGLFRGCLRRLRSFFGCRVFTHDRFLLQIFVFGIIPFSCRPCPRTAAPEAPRAFPSPNRAEAAPAERR